MNASSICDNHLALDNFGYEEPVNAGSPRLFPFQPLRYEEQFFREEPGEKNV
jgi:hypothetical protein